LLAKKIRKKNARHLEVTMDNTESLKKIWKWAKMNPTPEELKNKFSPVKEDRKGLRGSWEQSGAKRGP